MGEGLNFLLTIILCRRYVDTAFNMFDVTGDGHVEAKVSTEFVFYLNFNTRQVAVRITITVCTPPPVRLCFGMTFHATCH